MTSTSAGEASDRAEAVTQLARAQGLQRRFEEAHRTLDEAAALLGAGASRARVRYLLERGRAFNSSGDTARAKALFVEGFDMGLAPGEDALAVDAAHMVAMVGPAGSALAWNLRAVELAEASADPKARRWLPSLDNNIGWTRFAQGRFDEALRSFERALRHREREAAKPADRGAVRWCVARVWRALDRTGAALAEQRVLYEQATAAGEAAGYPAEEIGECLLAPGRADEAAPWFARAFDLLSADAWLRANEPNRVARLARLGGVAPPA